MDITEILKEDAIKTDLEATDRDGVIREMVELLANANGLSNKDEIIEAVVQREELMSTGIGQGIGIPHAKTNGVSTLMAAFGRSKNGIDYHALDGQQVQIFFLLVAPEEQSGPHVKALARISRLLKHAYFRQVLLDAKSSKEVVDIIREEEKKQS